MSDILTYINKKGTKARNIYTLLKEFSMDRARVNLSIFDRQFTTLDCLNGYYCFGLHKNDVYELFIRVDTSNA